MLASLEEAIDFIHKVRPWSAAPGGGAPPQGDLPDGLALVYERLGAPNLFRLGRLDRKQVHYGAMFAARDCLLPPSRLVRSDGTIEFAVEAQSNWTWRTLAGPGDPPVTCSYDPTFTFPRPPVFRVVCQSLRAFLVTFCLQGAVVSSRSCRSLVGAGAAPELDAAQLLWTGPYVDASPLRFYGVPGTGLLIMESVGPTGVDITIGEGEP
ncbi:MAG: hypothetical protein U0414_33525 [Polyangiaceae bacterium]